MRRRKLTYSMQQAITLTFSLLTLSIVAAAILIAYQFTLDEVRYASTDYISQLVSQVNGNIDQYVTYMEDVSEVVRKNTSVRRWVGEVDTVGPSVQMVLEDNVINQLTGIVNVRSDISSIGVFTPSGLAVFNSRGKNLNPYSDYENTDWYQEALARGGASFVSSSHVQNVIEGRYDWVVSVSRAITTGSGDILGVLLVDLNYSLINDLCASVDMGMQGYLFVVDRDGNIIYHPQQQLIYSRIKSEEAEDVLGRSTQVSVPSDSGSKLYISNYSDVTGWTVVGVVNEAGILQNRANIFPFYMLFVVIFLLLGAVLSSVICKALTDPIRRLVTTMQDIRSGDLDRRIEISSQRETGQLGLAFNEMLARLNRSIQQQKKDQDERWKSELKALQAQINPHFLYNTLDSIIWMAENGDSESVVEMTAALARLFRSSISEPREMVPLAVEIANIRSYLTIQEMRYKEKLKYEIHIPTELLTCPIPKLLLQPLVENAIYHGIKPKNGPGKITLEGLSEDGNLIIDIADNGIGMTKGQLENILRTRPASGGIGITNIHRRIGLIYGPEYGLSCASTPGGGTVVRATLPLEYKEMNIS